MEGNSMGKKVSRRTRQELLTAVVARYARSGREDKTRILDEFARITGYHRKHAIRLLSGQQEPTYANGDPGDAPAGTGRHRVYDEAFVAKLIVFWEAADRISGKRLVPLLPLLVSALERHGRLVLDAATRSKVLQVSPATADRLLRAARQQAACGRVRRSLAANSLKKRIPVRTSGDVKDPPIGMFEIDLVCHGGETMAGSFIHSLVLTDHASGWTECVALIVRDSALVVEGIANVRARLPFAIRGLDSDNGSEFINEHLVRYCEENSIEFTRSRPYQKNDQAWVEQKNGAIVRKMVGYARYEGLVAAQCFARFYAALRLYVNFFQPSFKLLEKRRVGARVKKRYLRPATPCDRLIVSPEIDDDTRARLRTIRERLDPIALLERIRTEQRVLAEIASGTISTAITPPDTDLDQFVQSLAIAFRGGEVRATHRTPRKLPAAPRHWRTRADPFDDVWNVLEHRLEQTPDMTALGLFEALRLEHPGRYSDGQLRTLQRRVKAWRTAAARELLAIDAETTIGGIGSVRSYVSPESNVSS
jgi:hypothetical protein